MNRLFEKSHKYYVDLGYLYLPLLFDSDIEKQAQLLEEFRFDEIESLKRKELKENMLLKDSGILYVRSVNLDSLLENFRSFDTENIPGIRKDVLKSYSKDSVFRNLKQIKTLQCIIIGVMPFFIKKNKRIERKRFTENDIIGIIKEHVDITSEYNKKADEYLDYKPLEKILKEFEEKDLSIEYPKCGIIESNSLKKWVFREIRKVIIDSEKEKIKTMIHEKQDYIEKNREYIATLLFLRDNPKLEIDGFGFFKDKSNYCAYVRTGEYVLSDFDRTLYKFPDCRVGVFVVDKKITNPFVIDNYKHPFLDYHQSGGNICIRSSPLSKRSNAENIIESLNTGINTLFYGYTNRNDFAGYHKLAKKQFIENMISRDDKRIKSGELEIKNDLFI